MKFGMVFLLATMMSTAAFSYDQNLALDLAAKVGGHLDAKCDIIPAAASTIDEIEYHLNCGSNDYDYLISVTTLFRKISGSGEAYDSSGKTVALCKLSAVPANGKVKSISLSCKATK
jgi:hypothetical protein